MTPRIVSIVIAYLLGSIPFGYLLVRFFRKEDIRERGSGNIGATNVLRSGAKGLGVATLVLDLGKALAGVMVAKLLVAGQFDVAMLAALAAVAGHVFPLWLGFRGGKGVASALGVLLALCWPVALVAMLVFGAVVVLSRYVSLASIAAAIAVPIAAWFLEPVHTPIAVCGFLCLSVLVIVKHHANVGRLLRGTENRFGSSRTEKAGA